MNDLLKSMAEDIKNSQHLVAFTGAGCSSESGIPTYRGEGGLWSKYDPNLYANINYFNQDPSYYWNFFKEVRYPMLKTVEPNEGHKVLAQLETSGRLKTLITQNIDGLHQDAGSSSIIELHGTTRTIFCRDCSHRYSMDDIFLQLETRIPPVCQNCQGSLRPAVVFFGESLDPANLQQAYHEAEICDFFLVVGSSLVVYPAADIPLKAKHSGATLAILNKDATPLDHLADYVIHEASSQVLLQVAQYL